MTKEERDKLEMEVYKEAVKQLIDYCEDKGLLNFLFKFLIKSGVKIPDESTK